MVPRSRGLSLVIDGCRQRYSISVDKIYKSINGKPRRRREDTDTHFLILAVPSFYHFHPPSTPAGHAVDNDGDCSKILTENERDLSFHLDRFIFSLLVYSRIYLERYIQIAQSSGIRGTTYHPRMGGS